MRGLIRGLLTIVAGAFVGGFAAYWLRWLQWGYNSPGSDHSFDYAGELSSWWELESAHYGASICTSRSKSKAVL